MSVVQDSAGFTVGGVIRRMVGLLRQNPGALIALAVIFSGVLPFLIGFAYARITIAFFGREQFLNLRPIQPLILLPLTTIPAIISQAAVTHFAASGERGWALGPSLRTALRVFFPNLGLYVLTNLAISAASLLLVVPGLMVACRYMVVIPVEVVERTGVSGALARSRDLTQGCRWRIFGLMLILGLIYLVLEAVQLLLARAFYGVAAVHLVPANAKLVSALIGGFIGTLGATAIYLELRQAKEGGVLSEIASVFE